ncbi:MAG: hypothetical protein MJZ11_00085 [Lachnospiraceae bacterium]|nr:hypothetical protein [Lachnospiraceae bacterium]
MKKNNIKIAYFLVLVMFLLSFTGCSPKRDENAEALKDAVDNLKNYVYKKNEIDLGIEIKNVEAIRLVSNNDEIMAIYTASIPEEENNSPEGESMAPEGEPEGESIAPEEAPEGENIAPEGESEGESIAPEAISEDENIKAEEATNENITSEGNEEDKKPEIIEDNLEENAPENKEQHKMYAFKLDDKGNATKVFDTIIYSTVRNIKLSPQGDILLISTVPGENFEDKYFFSKLDKTGNEIFKISIDDIIDENDMKTEYMYVKGLISFANQTIISTTAGVIRLDVDGNLLSTIPYEKIDSKIRDFQSMMLSDSNELYVISYFYGPGAQSESGSDSIVAKVDPETFNVISKKTVPANSFMGSLFPGNGNEAWMSTTSMISLYDIETNESVKVMDFVASNIDAQSPFSDIIGISKDAFYGAYTVYDTATWEQINKLFFFTHIPKDEIPDKKFITVGVLNMDYNVRKAVYEFNESSLAYQVNMLDYSSMYKGSPEDILKQINKDASSGKLPDVLLVDPTFPVDVYINKNLLVDLTPYIKEDPDLDYDDMLPNVNEAYSVDGKLYQLVPNFVIETMIIKDKFGKGRTSWTIEEAYDFWKEQGFDKKLDAFNLRNNLIEKILSCTKDSFIDWENGTCNFETEDFYLMLDFLKHVPDKEIQNSDGYEDVFSQYRKDGVLSYCGQLFSFSDYNFFSKGYIGDSIDFIGYPSSDGNGSVIVPRLALAMNNYSECKEGAWEFMKVFFNHSKMKELGEMSFPNSKKMLDELAKEAMESKEVFEFPIAGENVKMGAIDKKSADMLIDFVKTVDDAYRIDSAVSSIFNEECAPYFAGQKSDKQVAKVIQSRISLYLAESR